MNAAIGCGYRYNRNNFVFSVGIEGSYCFTAFNISNLDFLLPMRDTEGDLFDMRIRVSRSRDVTRMADICIPVLLGGEWGRFYWMAGPKLAISVYGSAYSRAEYTTIGEYDRYYDDFQNMPDHQFVSDQITESELLPVKWNMDVRAHLEIGARLDRFNRYKGFHAKKAETRMYLAVYADAGLLNLRSEAGNIPIFDYKETPDAGLQFFIQPVMRSSLTDRTFVRNIHAGIKFTVAFELQQRGKSYKYDDSSLLRRASLKRGGNQALKN